jgi:hypothetical protein
LSPGKRNDRASTLVHDGKAKSEMLGIAARTLLVRAHSDDARMRCALRARQALAPYFALTFASRTATEYFACSARTKAITSSPGEP